MTTISPTTSGTTAASTTGDTSAATQLGVDFNMFLKLLTTQMQNQDPLNPMDTSQYTQQLVQYSQVEQSIQQTATLKSILAGMGTQNLSQASTLIGRQVAFDSPVGALGDATPATWGYSGTRDIASLTATITDSAGHVIETRSLDPSSAQGRFSWDGTLSSGGTAPAGAYTLGLTAVDAAGVAVPMTIQSIGTVQDARFSNGAVTLGINGQQLPLSLLSRVGG